MTDIQAAPKFSAELFAAFWAAPDLSRGSGHPGRRHHRLLAGRRGAGPRDRGIHGEDRRIAGCRTGSAPRGR